MRYSIFILLLLIYALVAAIAYYVVRMMRLESRKLVDVKAPADSSGPTCNS